VKKSLKKKHFRIATLKENTCEQELGSSHVQFSLNKHKKKKKNDKAGSCWKAKEPENKNKNHRLFYVYKRRQ
jgi:hypothetical protein